MRERLMLHGAAVVAVVAVLALLAAPGYVLAYDMVFVPQQPLRWDLIAPTDALPRAVPLDLLVALVTQVVPGWLVQKAILAATIYAAAVGAGRLVPAERGLTQLVAAIGYAWTPYLAERLLLGHWGLLLCYAALPWLVAAALDLSRNPSQNLPRSLPRLVLAAAVASVTPTGGVIAFATTCALVLSRRRAALIAVAATAALNAPWVLAAAVTSAGGRSDPTGVAAFAARGENWSGPLGALAGTGGVWNAETVPASRESPLVPVVTALLLALAVAGFPTLRRRWEGGATRLAVLALAGFVLAAAGTWPGAPVLEWLVRHVPGAGLLRDGQKFLIPYVLVLVICAALGAERINKPILLVAAALLPVALMPDLALGGAGRLRPVEYPRDWDVVAARIAAAPGQVVSLPFQAFRTYPWNHGHVVIDPAPRYFAAPVLADDTLRVGDLVVAGENPRAAEVRRQLAAGEQLSGVRWVVVQHNSGGVVPPGALAGLRVVHDGPALSLYENPAETSTEAPRARWPLPLAGHLLAAAVVLTFAYLRISRRPMWPAPLSRS